MYQILYVCKYFICIIVSFTCIDNMKKVSFYFLISLLSIFARKSVVLSQPNINFTKICPGFELQKIHPVLTAKNAASCPSKNSQIIYVSPIGNDSNDGLSQNKPVKSLSKAVSLVRRTSPDWIVLERGKTFNDSFGIISHRAGQKLFGSSHIDFPMVITSYGKSLQRPVVKPTKDTISLWGPFKNVTISGLKFEQQRGSGGSGIRALYGGSNFVIHNNYIDGFSTAIILQGESKEDKWFVRTIIQDNVLVNSASSGKEHSQGIYASGYKILSIKDNVLDTCGWYKDRNGAAANSRIATLFNHCLYLQSGSDRAIVKGNIITRASSHGLQARSGAFVEGNIFARNPNQMFLSSKGHNGVSNKETMVARNNVVLEGNDINDKLPRGTGIQHNNAYNAVYTGNIVANLLSSSRYNKKALDVVCRTDDVFTSINDRCQSLFAGNLVYNWSNELGGTALSTKNYNTSLSIKHTFQVNKFVSVNPSSIFVKTTNEILSNRYEFLNNAYMSSEINNRKMFSLPGQPKVSFAAWKKDAEPNARGINNFAFTDPCRTGATYYDDFVLGDSQNNCKIMHNDNLFEKFVDLAKQRNTMTGKSGVDVDAFINYMKEGFVALPAATSAD